MADVVALMQWGDRYARRPRARRCCSNTAAAAGAVDEHRDLRALRRALSARDARALAGPGAAPDHPLLLRDARRASSTPQGTAPLAA